MIGLFRFARARVIRHVACMPATRFVLISIFISTAYSLSLADYDYKKLTCRDEQGLPVDWFTLYKFPKQANSLTSKWIQDGSGYAFMTDKNQNWTLSTQSINSSNSLPGKTLDRFYTSTFNNDTKLGYILYNDQFDDKSLASRAHAKGIIYFDDKTAIWIAHSIPNYPPKQESRHYQIDDGQLRYAQSMICLSLNVTALDQIGRQLLLAYPQIYDSFVPESLKFYSSFNDVYAGKRNKLSPFSNVETLKTLGNNQFIALHKSAYFANDLYSELVAKYFTSSLFVETWSNGVGTMASNCNTTYPVHNIDQINFEKFKTTFSIHSDHSKWTLSLPKTKTSPKYTCIGDINRQSSQSIRGGGTICFKNNIKVWQAYYDIIDAVEPCLNETPITL